jgi:inositol polyphosphate 5-phosphatase INPP5B/F
MKTKTGLLTIISRKTNEFLIFIVISSGCNCRHIFWMGDLNYRITLERESIEALVEYKYLYKNDQLFIEKTHNRIFKDYIEPPISFPPTYKYDVGTDDWDSSEKARAPAFCDRILYKGQRIEPKKYDSVMTFRQSDHKPVYGVFEVQLQKRDEMQFKRVMEEVLSSTENY